MNERSQNISIAFTWVWFALLMLIATYVRVYGTEVYHYHVDELMHIDIAKANSFKEMLQFSLFETHPPLGHILRYYWLQIYDAVWFIRVQSLIFGLGMIPLYFAIGNKLNGRLTGMCAAVLIAFGNGCIIQSYVVRNYSMLAFFISLYFYFYLLWQDDRKNLKLLACCGISGVLAVSTHFAAIFTLFCVTLFETMRMYSRKSGKNHYIKWWAINAIQAAMSALTLYVWHQTISPVQEAAGEAMTSYTFSESLLLIPLYLVHVFSYLFPNQYFILLLAFLIPLAVIRKNKDFNSLLVLAGIALLLGTLLFITGIYPFAGDRHGLWLLPFFIVPASWILADALLFLVKSPTIAAAVMLTAGIMLYPVRERFSDPTEYRMTESEWQQVSTYLQSIDNKSLLVSGRTDAIMLAPPEINIYRYLGNAPASVSPIAAIIPYYNTHLLFNNRNTMRIYKSATLLQMIKEIPEEYDNLIFIDTYVASRPIVNLALCRTLDKRIISFPATEQEHIFTSEEISRYATLLIVVKKTDFFDQVIAPGGKAHGCL